MQRFEVRLPVLSLERSAVASIVDEDQQRAGFATSSNQRFDLYQFAQALAPQSWLWKLLTLLTYLQPTTASNRCPFQQNLRGKCRSEVTRTSSRTSCQGSSADCEARPRLLWIRSRRIPCTCATVVERLPPSSAPSTRRRRTPSCQCQTSIRRRLPLSSQVPSASSG